MTSAYAAAETETERALIGIWQDLLGVKRLGTRDDFFELGGHSLLAMQVVARIRSALAVNLPLNDLFEKPTVAGLAERIETLRWANRGIAAPNGSAGERTEIEL